MMKIPDPYQVRGVDFLTSGPTGRRMNGDDPGLGKTLQGIEAAKKVGGQRILVICPKPVKGSWDEKIQEQDPRPVIVIQGSNSNQVVRCWERATDKKAAIKPTWIIVHYEFVRLHWEKIVKWNPDVLICDESHKFKNRSTRIGQVMQRLSTRLPDSRWFLLTGTPIWNKGVDLWNQLYVASKRQIGPYWSWVEANFTMATIRAGGGRPVIKILEPKDPKAFAKSLEPWIIRREKKDVLTDLKPVSYEIVPLDMDGPQRKAYATMHAQSYATVAGKEVGATTVIAQIIRLKQIAVSHHLLDHASKLVEGAKVEWLEGLVEHLDGKKILAFSQFAQAINRLPQSLPGVLTITGDTPDKHRPQILERFIKGDDQVLAMSFGVGGVGIDGLQDVCSNAVLLDYDWTPAVNIQAISRLDRRGQKEMVTVWTPMIRNTIEWWIYNRTNRKAEVAEMSIPVEDARTLILEHHDY